MKRLLLAAVLLPCLSTAEPLEDAEVRLPYSELKKLLEQRQAPDANLPASLSAARLKIRLEGDRVIIDATFRTLSFSDKPVLIPLIGGAVSLESTEPQDIDLLVRDGEICHAAMEIGASRFTARFLGEGPELELMLPPCPSLILETEEAGLLINDQLLAAGQPFPLAAAGGKITVRALSTVEVEEKTRPPEPSDWSWQFQTLVRENEGELIHHITGRASAAGGSGLSAELVLPADARDLEAAGDDLTSHRTLRDADGGTRLMLEWGSRDLLEREITLAYRRPLRPLDTTWQLVSPQGAGENKTRFLIAANPRRAFEAAGLAGPFDAENLSVTFREALAGSPYFTLEGTGKQTRLGALELPLVATADAVIPEATWQVRQESDGSRLVEGMMSVEHRQPLRVAFESPAGFSLLTCAVNGRDTRPVDRGDGKIEIPLPPGGKVPTKLQLSFTANGDALDPVAGTLALALPRTPVFIRSLSWRIDLPAAYRAEVHGNLARENLVTTDPRSAVRLRKNLCRDEVPAVSVFYQRADLTAER